MAAKKHSHYKTYYAVFASLLVLTLITVAISKVHLPIFLIALALALVVALTKGSLVAAYFMHLIGENRMVYVVLIITVVFFAVMLAIPVLTYVSDYRIAIP